VRARESLQLKIYALAWQQTSDDHARPAAVELHFIESGAVGRALVTGDTLGEAREAIAVAAAGIRARQFTATPGYSQCGFCAYNAICPARARGAFG